MVPALGSGTLPPSNRVITVQNFWLCGKDREELTLDSCAASLPPFCHQRCDLWVPARELASVPLLLVCLAFLCLEGSVISLAGADPGVDVVCM